MRQSRAVDVERLDPGIRRLVNPHIYHVSLTPALWNLKQRLITEAIAARKYSKPALFDGALGTIRITT
ncbi:MAG: hypothetical protein R2932_09815 [Caldilineaceae bacterium]